MQVMLVIIIANCLWFSAWRSRGKNSNLNVADDKSPIYNVALLQDVLNKMIVICLHVHSASLAYALWPYIIQVTVGIKENNKVLSKQ